MDTNNNGNWILLIFQMGGAMGCQSATTQILLALAAIIYIALDLIWMVQILI
jgi:hypothetical protein